jgi:ATP-dependent Zn protease
MAVETFQNLPSSAIESITIDSQENKVVIQYKSSQKNYTYSTEDADTFQQQFMAEFDSNNEEVSVGRFINQSVTNGTLTLLQD